MAIWQYPLRVVPEYRIRSYAYAGIINANILEDINCLESEYINPSYLGKILPQGKSWSNDIIIFGEEDSNCIEIISCSNTTNEINIRIDLRSSHTEIIENVCLFTKEIECVFINYAFNIVKPDVTTILEDIDRFPYFKNFFNKIKP